MVVLCLFLPSILLLSSTSLTSAFVAYDCSTPLAETLRVDLNTFEPCPAITPAPNATKIHVQVIQLKKMELLAVRSCRVTLLRTVHGCGDISKLYPHISGLGEVPVRVSEDACRKLWSEGFFTYVPNKYFNNIPTPGVISKPATLAGTVSASGSCTNGQYEDALGTYANVFVQGTYKIVTRQLEASWDMESGKLLIPQESVVCDAGQSSCVGAELDTYIWPKKALVECTPSQYVSIHDGPAEITDVEGAHASIKHLLSVNTPDRLFAVPLTSRMSVCGFPAWGSTQPGIIVIEKQDGMKLENLQPPKAEDVNLLVHLSTKIQYMEKHIGSQMSQLYAKVSEQQCTLYRSQMKSLLSLAVTNPTEFAYNYLGSGYSAELYHDQIILTRCTPVLVKRAASDKCTMELPVIHKNETMYMMPRTKLLQTTFTPRTCTPQYSPAIQINETWYSFYPDLSKVDPPQKLTLSMNMEWKYESIGDLVTRGFYDKHAAQKLQERMIFHNDRIAMSNRIADQYVKSTDVSGDISSYNLWSKEDRARLMSDITSKLTSFWWSFSLLSAGVWGVITVVKLIKLLIETIINARLIVKAYGWGVEVLAAFFTALTTHLVTKKHMRRNDPSPAAPPAEDPEDQPPLYSSPVRPPVYPSVYLSGEGRLVTTQQFAFLSYNRFQLSSQMAADHNDQVQRLKALSNDVRQLSKDIARCNLRAQSLLTKIKAVEANTCKATRDSMFLTNRLPSPVGTKKYYKTETQKVPKK